jgi:hypothetical protein
MRASIADTGGVRSSTSIVGSAVAVGLCVMDGAPVTSSVGAGVDDGEAVGIAVGASLGIAVGSVGTSVGAGVGSSSSGRRPPCVLINRRATRTASNM